MIRRSLSAVPSSLHWLCPEPTALNLGRFLGAISKQQQIPDHQFKQLSILPSYVLISSFHPQMGGNWWGCSGTTLQPPSLKQPEHHSPFLFIFTSSLRHLEDNWVLLLVSLTSRFSTQIRQTCEFPFEINKVILDSYWSHSWPALAAHPVCYVDAGCRCLNLTSLK